MNGMLAFPWRCACIHGQIKAHRGPRHLKDFGAPPIYIYNSKYKYIFFKMHQNLQ